MGCVHGGRSPFFPFDEPEPRPTRAPVVPRAPAARLIDSLARVCRERPLEEKILVAPSLAIGHTLRRAARPRGASLDEPARRDGRARIALGLVGPDLAREGLRLLSRAQALALVEQACAEVADARNPTSGRCATGRASTARFQRTFEELRAAGSHPRPPCRREPSRTRASCEELQGVLSALRRRPATRAGSSTRRAVLRRAP